MFNLTNFLKHFLLSGIIIGTFAYFSEESKNELCAFLYCGLPIGFIYMFLLAKMNREEQVKYTFGGIVGTIFFLFYMLFFYLILKYTKINIFINILLCLFLFLITLVIVDKFFYKII